MASILSTLCTFAPAKLNCLATSEVIWSSAPINKQDKPSIGEASISGCFFTILKGISTVKIEPLLTSLFTEISPPINSANCRLITKPNPLPP